MVQLPVYLDNHATTRVDPRVLEAMLPFFCDRYGNPASPYHVFGRQANEAVARARHEVAQLIGAEEREIIFTSGATESNNLAIKGTAWALRRRGNHIITAATEHKATLDPCQRLEAEGFEVTIVPVDRFGRVDPAQVADAITDRTVLVTIMAANNEIGTLQPVADIGAICRARGVVFHTDAAQAVGRIPVHVDQWAVDLLSLSGHKLYGPKGIGALYVRRGERPVRLVPLIDGGGHERGIRSGTLATPNIVGLGEACRLARIEGAAEAERIRRLRDLLADRVCRQLEAVEINGHPSERLPGNLNLRFAAVRSEPLLLQMKDLAASAGSACTSLERGPSHVLKAIGLDDAAADSSVRFGIGRFNTEEEILWAADYIVENVHRLRQQSPVWHMMQSGNATSDRH